VASHPPSLVAAFAAFVRQLVTPRQAPRNVAMVIAAAAETFAPTAQARARLLRQAHANGLLSARETEDALVEMRAIGAPRS
jgi:hypothetical protein